MIVELGNIGAYNTSGNFQSVYGLTNTGDFDCLMPIFRVKVGNLT
jgi:hypothetical protein